MPVIDVGDATLFCTDTGQSGPGSGTPILLVHGWTCDSHDWCFQLPAFEEDHRVIAVDLRGHGRSSVPAKGYTAQDYASDLAALLSRLGVGQVVVVGHSLGGSVAAALAVEHEPLVRAMIAVEPAYGQDEATVEWMRDASTHFGTEAGSTLAAQLMSGTEALAPAWLKTWHGRRTLGMDPALLAQTFQDLYFTETQISGRAKSEDYLSRRRVPTLAFHRLPDMAAWEAGTLQHPASRVVSWEGSGHWLHQQRPEDFNALVLAWIADLPDTPDALAGSTASQV